MKEIGQSSTDNQKINQHEVEAGTQIHQDDHEHDHDHEDHALKEYTASEMRSIQIRGWLCILGGIFLHLVLGTFYVWGTISPYVAAYLKQFDPSVTMNLMAVAFPFLSLVTDSVLSFGVKLALIIGYRSLIFLSSTCIALAFLVCSFMTNVYAFIMIYCIFVGIPTGLSYMLPVICGWKYFPNNQGRVSGLIIAGYGFGSLIFNFIAQAIVNPTNQEPNVIYIENGKKIKYFSSEVYDKVPEMFRILAACYFILGIVATILVNFPRDLHLEYYPVAANLKKNDDHVDSHINNRGECQSIQQGLKSKPFIVMVPVVVCSVIYGMFMANCYKLYGLSMGMDDKSLTIIGSIGSAFNGCSRAFWAMLMDKIGYKKTYFFLIFINLITTSTIGYVNGNFTAYLILYCLTMGSEGGLISTYPVITKKMFGPKVGSIMYGTLFFFIGIACLAAYFIFVAGIGSIGYAGLFWISFGFNVIAFLLGFIVPEYYVWKK